MPCAMSIKVLGESDNNNVRQSLYRFLAFRLANHTKETRNIQCLWSHDSLYIIA